MKKIGVLLILVFAIACKNNSKSEVESSSNDDVATEQRMCSNEVPFGNVEICLPEIDGIVDAFSHPKVRARAMEFEDDNNIILGYYIDDETFAKADNFESVTYDNYYKVYASTGAVDYTMGVAELNEMMKLMTSGFLDKTVEEVNASSEFTKQEISVSQPTLIEKYSLDRNASSLVVLMGLSTAEESKVMAIDMTALLIKDRLIFVAHYLDYNGEASIEQLKSNSDKFNQTFLDINS